MLQMFTGPGNRLPKGCSMRRNRYLKALALSLETTTIIQDFIGGFSVNAEPGGVHLISTSETRTFANGFTISYNINIGGKFHPLPNRFAALTMDADCGRNTGKLNLFDETDITICKIELTDRINPGIPNSDIEVTINNSKIYGDVFF